MENRPPKSAEDPLTTPAFGLVSQHACMHHPYIHVHVHVLSVVWSGSVGGSHGLGRYFNSNSNSRVVGSLGGDSHECDAAQATLNACFSE